MSAKDHERMQRAGEVIIDYELSKNVTMETIDNGAFDHDITIISYVLAAANYGKNVISVFVLLVYWVYRAKMERWDGTVLGPQCLQLLGMHALSGCNTTSY